MAAFRTGQFSTWSDVANVYKLAASLQPQMQLCMDDRTFEGPGEDFKLVIAQGYCAEYYCLKGNLTRSLQKIKANLD